MKNAETRIAVRNPDGGWSILITLPELSRNAESAIGGEWSRWRPIGGEEALRTSGLENSRSWGAIRGVLIAHGLLEYSTGDDGETNSVVLTEIGDLVRSAILDGDGVTQ